MPAIDRRILAATLLFVTSTATARHARAQNAPSSPSGGETAAATAALDSLPFRAGQWGADFAISDGAVGLGVLRLRSPRMAWTLNASVDADWRSTDYTYIPENTPHFEADGNSMSLGLRAGPRWYRPVTAGVAAYVGTGVTGQLGRIDATASGNESRWWDLGGYGDVGAAYFVTRRLSLGAQTGMYLTYGKSTIRSSEPLAERRDRTTRIGVTPVRILGALYF